MCMNFLLKGAMSALCLFSAGALAGISLDSPRIIFSAADSRQGQSVGITSSSDSPSPFLVNAQVMANVAGSPAETPFSVTPSLFRLEPGATNRVRILKTGSQVLPTDKESVFYFRAISVPAGKGSESLAAERLNGTVTVSTGNIIKLFYRPGGLSVTPQQAMSSLTFSLRGSTLSVSNPSPYFVTLKSLVIGGKKIALSIARQNTMLAPFGKMDYSVSDAMGKVTWQTINDYGGVETFHGTIQ